jgi:hypothetical protein
MNSNAILHELRVDAVDPTTGKAAWSHAEKVTISKTGG